MGECHLHVGHFRNGRHAILVDVLAKLQFGTAGWGGTGASDNQYVFGVGIGHR